MQRPSVRLVLAVSLDGRLSPASGGPAHLGGEGDRRVLEQALAWCDAVLIGAGTLRAHRCTCLIHNQQLQFQRRLEGRSPQPTAMVISRNPDFPLDWPFFQQPINRHLINPDQVQVDGFSTIHRLHASWEATLAGLEPMGFHRLVLLGGAGLCGSLLEEDLVDELQLTLAPCLLGGRFSWVPTSGLSLPASLMKPDAWTLLSADPLGGHELVIRYQRRRLRRS